MYEAVPRIRLVSVIVLGGGSRYPEVCNLGLARSCEQHVLGLYVAVDYAVPVRDREGVGDP